MPKIFRLVVNIVAGLGETPYLSDKKRLSGGTNLGTLTKAAGIPDIAREISLRYKEEDSNYEI
ncbi:MAG: hypothetical protein ACREPW_13765 [Candidatus Binataceae bacterium]